MNHNCHMSAGNSGERKIRTSVWNAWFITDRYLFVLIQNVSASLVRCLSQRCECKAYAFI